MVRIGGVNPATFLGITARMQVLGFFATRSHLESDESGGPHLVGACA